MTTHYLRAWSEAGWTGRDATVPTAAGCSITDWSWADLRGLQHAATLPPQPPITGRVWGGQQGGPGHGCGAVLTMGDAAAGEPVTLLGAEGVSVFRPRSWVASGAALAGRSVRCLRADRPLTFVELR